MKETTSHVIGYIKTVNLIEKYISTFSLYKLRQYKPLNSLSDAIETTFFYILLRCYPRKILLAGKQTLIINKIRKLVCKNKL